MSIGVPVFAYNTPPSPYKKNTLRRFYDAQHTLDPYYFLPNLRGATTKGKTSKKAQALQIFSLAEFLFCKLKPLECMTVYINLSNYPAGREERELKEIVHTTHMMDMFTRIHYMWANGVVFLCSAF